MDPIFLFLRWYTNNLILPSSERILDILNSWSWILVNICIVKRYHWGVPASIPPQALRKSWLFYHQGCPPTCDVKCDVYRERPWKREERAPWDFPSSWEAWSHHGQTRCPPAHIDKKYNLYADQVETAHLLVTQVVVLRVWQVQGGGHHYQEPAWVHLQGR